MCGNPILPRPPNLRAAQLDDLRALYPEAKAQDMLQNIRCRCCCCP